MFKKTKLFALAGLISLMYLCLPSLCYADGISKGNTPVTSSSAEALNFFNQGREAFEMGRISDANILLDKAIQKDPTFASAYLFKALASNTNDERLKQIELAHRNSNHVSDAEKIQIQLEFARLKGDNSKQFELAKKLAGKYSECPRALILLSQEFQTRNDIYKTRDLASRVILVAPDSPIGYRTLAASYLLNEPVDFELALQYMQKYTELRPNEANAFISLGDVYRANLDLALAIDAYTIAIQLDPESEIAFSKRGYIHTFMGNVEGAREDFSVARTLVRKNQHLIRTNAGANNYVAKTDAKSEEPFVEKSNRAKNNRYQLAGPSPEQYFCCTLIGMMHGSYSLYGQELNGCNGLINNLVFESKPPDPATIEANISFMEGLRAMSYGDFILAEKKAIEHARQVNTHKNPKKCEVYDYMMGNIHLKQNNYFKAVGFLEKAATVNPFAKYNLGLAYIGIGEWEKSLAIFRDVLQFTSSSVYKPEIIRNAEKWEKKLVEITAENR